MGAILYRCPIAGVQVQGWLADDAPENGKGEIYQSMACLACRRLHLVNCRTGRILGDDKYAR
jgi:hypothetical protein